ncbi:MAG TPA: aminofutalosine synthase MqnE [Fibrobacteraceae bacterium]|nr:aminofutalosine synthase MqnE [Fibrobacteraceae bacterium]
MNFSTISDHVTLGKRLSPEEALWLFRNAPSTDLFQLADQAKRKRHGDAVYWVNNRQINYTNVCVLHCSFCAFSKIKKDSPTAYDWSLTQIQDKAREAVQRGARELHIVGGLHPDHGFDYYLDMVRNLHQEFPQVGIKAFTAVEIQHFAKLHQRPAKDILQELQSAGLRALPGGGAEILVQSVRDEICGPKETGEEWLETHRVAHHLGIPTNATMLFGHIESLEHRVAHMAMLRQLQDDAPGFFAFIPLVFHPENNALGRRIGQKAPPEDRLRTIAVSRLFLDNFPHIKAYWVQLGLDIARQALHAGASDLDGTIIEEKITYAAGSEEGQGLSATAMRQLIEEEGLRPVERDALYREY